MTSPSGDRHASDRRTATEALSSAPPLKALFAAHRGKVSDKWASYLDQYDRLFAPYRRARIRLLEIGVQNGGSLEIWARYFPRARQIVGCDIDPACAALRYEDPRIRVIIGDAGSEAVQQTILRETGGLEIVLDDGSHQSRDIVASFSRYFPLLSTNGLYVVEDLHCSYWGRFGGGLFDPFSAVAFLKRLADVVNYEHWGVEQARSAFMAGVAARYGVHLPDDVLETVHSVEFVNSLGIVRKQAPRRNKLRQRVISGSVATVYPKALQASHRPVRSDESHNEWSSREMSVEEELSVRRDELARQALQLNERERELAGALRSRRRAERQAAQLKELLLRRERDLTGLEEELAQRERDHQQLGRVLAEREQAVARSQSALAQRDRKIQRLSATAGARSAEMERLRAQLDAIHSSWVWRMAAPLRWFRAWVLRIRRAPGLARALRNAVRTRGVRSGLRLLRDYQALLSTRLFDADFYAHRNPDVVAAGMDLHLHYLVHGANEGRDPGPEFSTSWYLQHNPDVLEAGTNPLVHYIRFGLQEGRLPVGELTQVPSKPAPPGRMSGPEQVSPIAASVTRRLQNLEQYRAAIVDYGASRQRFASMGGRSPRIAIYTAITGNYDSIKLPEHLDPRLDYIVFSDRTAPATGVWQVRPIPFFDDDPTRVARFVKTHPHHLLHDYDVAIWIDSNVMLVGDIYAIVQQFLDSGNSVGALRHPLRASVYEELEACIHRKKDDPAIMRAQVAGYRDAGFEHDDLIESNFMMFDLRTSLDTFFQRWWTEVDGHSKRDQLSLNYSLWSTQTGWYRLMEHPTSVRNHPDFGFGPHDGAAGPAASLIEALGCPLIDPYQSVPYASVRHERIASQQSRRVDVIVCVHNALDDVQACLQSVVRARSGPQQRLIIVDDGSDTPTAEYLRSFAHNHAWSQLLRNEEARGYTRAANQGLAASSADLVILLNSDTLVTDAWADKLADAVFSTPGAGIVGPMSNAASYQSLPDIRPSVDQTAVNDLPPGTTPDDMNSYCEQWTPSHVLPIVPLVHGFCFGVTRDVLASIGRLDEDSFPRGYGEENDYCFRASDAGYSLVLATHTYIYHSKSRSYTTAQRSALAQAGGVALRRIHGSRRVARAVRTMERHPALVALRRRASELA
jgi:GT2 family glycosyltransferase